VTGSESRRCRCGQPAVAKGLCKRCYMRDWHELHPGKQAEYARAHRQRNRLPPPEPRTCPECGTVFEPRTANHKYCTGFRGACYRRAENRRYRGRYRPRRAYV
jgi:hypothetical protein